MKSSFTFNIYGSSCLWILNRTMYISSRHQPLLYPSSNKFAFQSFWGKSPVDINSFGYFRNIVDSSLFKSFCAINEFYASIHISYLMRSYVYLKKNLYKSPLICMYQSRTLINLPMIQFEVSILKNYSWALPTGNEDYGDDNDDKSWLHKLTLTNKLKCVSKLAKYIVSLTAKFHAPSTLFTWTSNISSLTSCAFQ